MSKKTKKSKTGTRPKQTLDAVTLEVIRNALPAIANEMAADLQRTSYNMMIYEVRDFCTSLVNTKGELISQNVGGVSHFVADLGVIITDGMARLRREGLRRATWSSPTTRRSPASTSTTSSSTRRISTKASC